ncbi:MAG: dinitrogenase iron-molybdenum cofactor biosynthesis protein [Candidatus Cloacimonetes bacterium]|nr:dinitrogenase iron-molybdenum cofactor biosynthesis protein [Candidatus Cloacimonadota bacterium]
MMKIKAAFATDDGITFVNRHFGDANYYDIYEFDNKEVQFVKRISNSVGEEELHASNEKAKGVTDLLRQERVSVVVSRVFGPNIERIKKQFVCVIVKDIKLENSIFKVIGNIETIKTECEKGDERQPLSL